METDVGKTLYNYCAIYRHTTVGLHAWSDGERCVWGRVDNTFDMRVATVDLPAAVL